MIIEKLLKAVCAESNILKTTIEQKGPLSLKEYCGNHWAETGEPIQGRQDFLEKTFLLEKKLWDEETASKIVEALKYPLLNTANHHGVDFFPQSVQGNYLYWQAVKGKGHINDVLPVISTGMIPINNSSYARGLMAAGMNGEAVRIPIFSKSNKNAMVTYMPAFTREQVESALYQVKHTLIKRISRKTKQQLADILESYYLDEDVLHMERYGDQATLLNRRIQRDCFKSPIPEIIYIEIETIINELVKKDLLDETSLLHRMLYDKEILSSVCEQAQEPGYMHNCFFCGMDTSGRKYGMEFCEDGKMRGRKVSGEQIVVSNEPAHLAELIEKGEILPSAYAVAIVLSFARGYTWLGGCFQGDYLPAWQDGTLKALLGAAKGEGHYNEWAEKIKKIPCNGFISGPVFLMEETELGILSPAGPVEILLKGGVTAERLEELLENTVKNTCEMGISNIYADVIAKNERLDDWYTKLGKELKEKYAEFTI